MLFVCGDVQQILTNVYVVAESLKEDYAHLASNFFLWDVQVNNCHTLK